MTEWRSRGYLPHIDGINLVQHITFHLADSLPRDALASMQRNLAALTEADRIHQRRQNVQNLLDSGHGRCLLGRVECARIVQESLLHGDGPRYRLISWVIMPNHVHVLIQQTGVPLAKIVQSWKRHTSREIHRSLKPGGQSSEALWHRDYWDRYIRDDAHLHTAVRYIEQNPVKAHLVAYAQDWQWGSAAIAPIPIPRALTPGAIGETPPP
jgi:REP element-mobilizing transposase RayT